jgi:hypothetical protein
MHQCTFELNNQPLSAFKIGAMSFPAFSGLGKHVNRRVSVCIPNEGPIPLGSYYIFARQPGGLLGPFRDLFNDKKEWFALYSIDDNIDDETYCQKVKRGNFRLHPKGPLGRSEGCITIEDPAHFRYLSAILKSSATIEIPQTGLKAYGRVVVK